MFGVNPDAPSSAIWVIERSTDLAAWTEIYRATDPASGADTPRPNIIAELIGNAVLLRDDEATGSRNFYRFIAEQTP